MKRSVYLSYLLLLLLMFPAGVAACSPSPPMLELACGDQIMSHSYDTIDPLAPFTKAPAECNLLSSQASLLPEIQTWFFHTQSQFTQRILRIEPYTAQQEAAVLSE